MERSMRRFILIPALLSNTLLIGCAVGPDFKTPETPTDPSYLNSLGEAAQIDVMWWKSFNDPHLEKLVNVGIEANKSIDQAVARLKESRAGRRATQFELAPIAPINGAVLRTKQSASNPFDSPFLGQPNDSYTVGFDATWELDIYGRVRRSVESAEATEMARSEDLKDAINLVLAEISRNYFELRGIQSRLAVARHNAENQAETVRITSALLSAGQATELDTARANSQYKTTKSTIPALEAEERAAMHRIATLCGEQPGTFVSDLSVVVPLPIYSGPVKIDSPAELLRRRPDIRGSEANLAAATANIGVAVGDLFPRVTFLGSLGFGATSYSDLGSSGTDTYTFGPQISWPALDLGRVYNRIKSRQASAEGALAAYEQTVLSALEDVESALVRYKKEQERFGFLKDAAAESTKAAKLARTQYQAGLVDFLTVLDAENAALLAEDSLTQSQTRLLTGLVSIYKALGGGWQGFELQTVESPKEK
jgi:multidrug efflux system outer membrane protein